MPFRCTLDFILNLRIREKDTLISKRNIHKIISIYIVCNTVYCLNKIKYEKNSDKRRKKNTHIQIEIVSETIRESKASAATATTYEEWPTKLNELSR